MTKEKNFFSTRNTHWFNFQFFEIQISELKSPLTGQSENQIRKKGTNLSRFNGATCREAAENFRNSSMRNFKLTTYFDGSKIANKCENLRAKVLKKHKRRT